MTHPILIASEENNDRDYLALITERLNQHYVTIKEHNPRGYLDQMDAQFESLCIEIASELGGSIEFKDGEVLFNFTRYHLGD